MENRKVGFIGAGNMAYAIGKALVTSGVVVVENVIASARTRTRLDTVWKELGTKTSVRNSEVVEFADIIFLSVKPHLIVDVIQTAMLDYSGDLTNKMFISVAAGITLDTMQKAFGEHNARVVRTIPNTPCMVQCGVLVYALGSHCTPDDGMLVRRMLEPIGLVEEVDEKQIDGMSTLIGCSIAWYQIVVEAIADGGVKNGVPRAIAYKLAAKAMEGSAKLVLVTGQQPGVLKEQMTIPGGSTICGLNELEQSGVRGSFMKAVDAATRRNQELGGKK